MEKSTILCTGGGRAPRAPPPLYPPLDIANRLSYGSELLFSKSLRVMIIFLYFEHQLTDEWCKAEGRAPGTLP